MTTDETERPFRVLTLDGGGMRGLYTASLLKKIAALFDARYQSESPDVGRAFDLICGTSTGSILAVALACGLPLQRVCELYEEHGAEIFPSPLPTSGKRDIAGWAWNHRRSASGDADVLQRELKKAFADETLGELYRRRGIAMCIPTVDATRHQAVVLKTPHHPKKTRDDRMSLVNACLASSAAPLFLPVACSPDPLDASATRCYVDGGLWANNPVLVGLMEALQCAHVSQPIHVVSVGTCATPNGDPADEDILQRGLLDWQGGVKIIEVSMGAQATGQAFTANLLAQVLQTSGRQVEVIRLEEEPRSPTVHSAIGLDRADQKALKTLRHLARADAELNHSKSIAGGESSPSVLAAIFTNLEPTTEYPKETDHV